MILQILVDPNPKLRAIAQRQDVFGPESGVERLANDMIDTVKAAGGIGLAAPQVGFPIRMIVVHHGGLTLPMVNPVIVKRSGQQQSREGCLSVDRKYWQKGLIARSAQVRVEYQDVQGEEKTWNAKGVRAVILEHEIDHLDGVLFTDRLAVPA